MIPHTATDSWCLSSRGKHHPQSFLSCCCLLTLTVLHKPRGTFQLQPSLHFKKQNPLWYIPLVSEFVRSIRPCGQCQEMICPNVIQTWMCVFFLFPNPTAQTDEKQTWGDVCSLLSDICIFFRGSFIEGGWWDGGRGSIGAWQGQGRVTRNWKSAF